MSTDRSTWLGALVVGLLVVGGFAACSDDGDDETSSTTSSAGTSTMPARSEEAAIDAWFVTEGARPYLGPCPIDFDPEFPLDGMCSVPLSADGDRSVVGVGPPFSEITTYLLIEEGEDGWAVVDTYAPAEPYDLSDAPDWVPNDGTVDTT